METTTSASNHLSGGEAHALDLTAVDEDLLDRRAVTDGAPQAPHQLQQTRDECARTADGEVHAPLALQVRNEAVDRGGGEGISADQERVKAQHLTQPLVLHEPGHQAVDRAVALELHHRRHHARHVRPAAEGNVRELLEADGEDLLAHRDEALVALEISRRELLDLRLHRRGITRVVERLPVVEPDPVKRRDGTEIDVIRHPLAAQRPELLEEEGGGDDRWPRVEGEATILPDARAPAWPVVAFEQRDLPAARPQTNRGGETAEATADDDGSTGLRSALHPAPSALYRVGIDAMQTVSTA